MGSEVVLQERKTLDDVIVEGVKTFYNGCNFRLIVEDGKYFLEYGCYGVHTNLASGSVRLLNDWMNGATREITNIVKPKTIGKLLDMRPCERCGGHRFKMIE